MIDEDPVTLSLAAVAGGSALSAGGGVIGGMNQESAGNLQAEQMRRQASLELSAAGAKISAEDQNANKAISQGVANAGASGVTIESAEPVLSENFSEQKIRDMYTRFSGQLASTNDLYQADLARYQGKQAFIGGIFKGVQSVLGGAGGIGNIRMAEKGMGNLSVAPGNGTAVDAWSN